MKNVSQIQGIHTDRETGHPTLKKGKLNLVDLAGSERHGKTGAGAGGSAGKLPFPGCENVTSKVRQKW